MYDDNNLGLDEKTNNALIVSAYIAGVSTVMVLAIVLFAVVLS